MNSSISCPQCESRAKTLGPHHFTDLDTVIDHVHALFSAWEQKAASELGSDIQTLLRVKLATHEWLANLVQHAAFRTSPYISIEFQFHPHQARCVIEDNSEGFDLVQRLEERGRQLDACPERGMGLLMLDACTEELVYQSVGDLNRLSFTISSDKEPWLDIPLHL
jgi:serine/threonine-protein kinase RsbW